MIASIAELREEIISPGHQNPEWARKMLHKVPNLPTVKDRGKYLVEKSRDRVVLDIGCTGPISQAIKTVAKGYHGIDKVASDRVEAVELDHRPDLMPKHDDVDLVICAEIIEHLSNPGYFLLALKDKYAGRECYITVPNAGAYAHQGDCEVVNAEHVCWYSYQTLRALLSRYDIEIKEARWYNGQPFRAEGIIAKVTL